MGDSNGGEREVVVVVSEKEAKMTDSTWCIGCFN